MWEVFWAAWRSLSPRPSWWVLQGTTAMTTLARLGKEHMFLWAWGINGCFSVIGAAIVPIVATSFGLTAVLIVAGVAYLVAIPAFFAVLLPKKGAVVAQPA